MRLVVCSGYLQDLVRRHTRALERSAYSNDLDQARNGAKISVCKVVSHLPRCDARLRLALKPFRAVGRPRLDTRQLIFIAVRKEFRREIAIGKRAYWRYQKAVGLLVAAIRDTAALPRAGCIVVR